MARRASSSRPILVAVLDAPALGDSPLDMARELYAAGVDWLQLRDRELETEALWRLACALVEAREAQRSAAPQTTDSRTAACVIVNKRIDVALASGADGVHLGFDALEPAEAAALLPADALIGASLHSPEEVEAASGSSLGYAHLAPIWDPLSKPATRAALGADGLARACGKGLPVIAQGGLDPQRAACAIRAGAAGIAVTGILGRAQSPARAARELRTSLDAALADRDRLGP